MTTPEAREAAQKVVDQIEVLNERYHGVATNWCPSDALELIAQALSSWRPQWLPIESAPKDGTAIMLWGPHMRVAQGRYRRPEDCTYGYAQRIGPGWTRDCAMDSDLQPTMWQPLPTPPSREDLT